MGQYNHNRLLTYTTLMLLLVAFVLINIISNIFFKTLRFDVSEQKIYTLSHGSKEIMSDIKEPINIKLYFSKELAQSYPDLINYSIRVQELLEQYQRASYNKVKIAVIDTEPFTVAEEQAINHGLQGMPVDGNDSNLYFGIAASNTLTHKEIIAFLQPHLEAYLEYDISNMICKLIYPHSQRSTEALIGIRNRAGFVRPFSTIKNLQDNASIIFQNQEKILLQRLEDVKQKLVMLEKRQKKSRSIANSVAQKREEEELLNKLVDTKRKLREVNCEINKSIERLKLVIEFINIALMPLLVLLCGSVFWLYRMRTNKYRYNHLLGKINNFI